LHPEKNDFTGQPVLNTEKNDYIQLNSNKRIYQLFEYTNRFTENDKLQLGEQSTFLKIDNYEGRDPRLIDEIASIPAEVFEHAFDGSYRIIWKINEHLIIVEALSKEYLDDLKFKGLLWIKGCRKLNDKEKNLKEMETRREANEREEMERGAKEREEKERDANEREEKERKANEQEEKERKANEQEEKNIYVNKNDDQEVFYLKELENIGKTYYIVLNNNIYQKHYIKYHDYDIYFIFNSDSDVIQSYVRCHCNRDSCLRDASGSNHTCVGINGDSNYKVFSFCLHPDTVNESFGSKGLCVTCYEEQPRQEERSSEDTDILEAPCLNKDSPFMSESFERSITKEQEISLYVDPLYETPFLYLFREITICGNTYKVKFSI